MARRVNISLPEDTLKLLDSVAPKGERSYVIAEEWFPVDEGAWDGNRK